MSIAAIKIVDSLQQGLDAFFKFIPNLIAFLVILIIGYFIAKIAMGIVRTGLKKVGVDRRLHESDAGEYVERLSPGASPSNGIGRVVFWIIFAFVLTAAIGALKIPAVTAFMNQVLAYLPNVIAAIVIFVIAAAIAGAAGGGAAAPLAGDVLQRAAGGAGADEDIEGQVVVCRFGARRRGAVALHGMTILQRSTDRRVALSPG